MTTPISEEAEVRKQEQEIADGSVHNILPPHPALDIPECLPGDTGQQSRYSGGEERK